MNSKIRNYKILASTASIITMIGLGISAYNYYVFDRPFINSTTMGMLTTFGMIILMISIGLRRKE